MRIEWIEPVGVISRDGDWDAVRVNHASGGPKNKHRRLSLLMTPRLLEEMRWFIGDRIKVGDGGDFFALTRTPNERKGYKVSGVRPAKGGRSSGLIQIIRKGVETEIDKRSLKVSQIHITECGMVLVPKKSITTAENLEI